jgi:hypothetical protein
MDLRKALEALKLAGNTASFYSSESLANRRKEEAKVLRQEMWDLLNDSPLDEGQKRDVLRKFQNTMNGNYSHSEVPDAPSEDTYFKRR